MRRPWAMPLVPLYWAGLRLKDGLRAAPKRLEWPVVSVGSLSAGGAGKTPVVTMLAELLGRHGVGVDVLSRGYGRGSGVVEEVDAAGSAGRFGDEPLEMARAGVRVFVGVDRYAAGMVAEALRKDGRASPDAHLSEDEAVAKMRHRRDTQITADSCAALRNDKREKRVHVLDDGFQHRRLARGMDVVLLTMEDARDWLLPAGNLREPLSALGRADVVVVREEEAHELQGVIARFTQAEVWVVRRELVLPDQMPRRPVAFCGIARPEGFLAMLREAGVETAGTVLRADHYAWTGEDVRMLVDAGRHAGADGFVTTGKDAVKISDDWRRELEAVGRFVVAGLRVRLRDEDAAMAIMRGRLRQSNDR